MFFRTVHRIGIVVRKHCGLTRGDAHHFAEDIRKRRSISHGAMCRDSRVRFERVIHGALLHGVSWIIQSLTTRVKEIRNGLFAQEAEFSTHVSTRPYDLQF